MKSGYKLLALCIVIISLTHTACTSTKPNSDDSTAETPLLLKISDIAERLLSSAEYTEELTKLDREAVILLYELEDEKIKEAHVYSGTAAIVETVALFETTDEEAAEQVRMKMQEFLAAQRILYSGYRPDEVPKLDSALLKKEGVYVFLCVSPDSTSAANVEKIIKNLLQGEK